MRSVVLLFACISVCDVFAVDWLSWRGPARDGVSAETGLLKKWPENGPAKRWDSAEAGIGYSGMTVAGNRIYTMGADDSSEYIIALDADNGKKVWQTVVGERLENGWGDGPRCTPTVAGDAIVAIGGNGGLFCVSAADGQTIWSVDLLELGGVTPRWGYSESPLINGDTVLCTPGGDQGTIAAFDLATGAKKWQSSEVTETAHYSSIVNISHAGKAQYLQLTQNKVFAIDHDGNLQWEAEWPLGRTAVVPTPIYHDGYVYVTSGYGAGCMLLKISDENEVDKVYDNKVMKNHHGGAILIDDHVFGYSDGPGWTCQNLLSGKMVWNEKRILGKGSIAFADGMFYCFDRKSGACALISASTEGWEERGRFTIQPQSEQRAPKGRIWTHPTIANGRLYLRDQEVICSYDISE